MGYSTPENIHRRRHLPMPISRKKKIPEKGYRQLRKHRYSQRGYFYFVTTRCFDNKKLFAKKDAVQIVFDTLDWLEQHKYIECYFAILMPDHLHLVFQLVGNKTLSEVMKSLKGFAGRKLKHHMGLDNPIWQEQFYDHTIREDEDLIEIIKYCLHNPVRAGLVEDPFDYPFWRSKIDLHE